LTTVLDILGGAIIGSLVLMLTLSATDRGTREFFHYNADAIVQDQIAQMAYITEYDLRKMGFGIHEVHHATILQIATASRIKFLSQLNFSVDNVADTIEYQISAFETISYGDTSLTTYRIWRKVTLAGQSPQTQMIGIIGNNNVFRYLDQVGHVAPIQQATRMVEVTFVAYNPRIILSPEMVSTCLDSIESADVRRKELTNLLRPSFWRQTRLVSKNLRR
jgi:hypothetical protein